MTPEERFARIDLILSDVDGVLTSGGITLDERGVEHKTFHVRDGLGIALWRRAGHRFGILTGRESRIVERRASELALDVVRQGVKSKLQEGRAVIAELGLDAAQVCYVGDDLPDIALMRHVGLGVAVADAAEETRAAAHHVTRAGGGLGAVRELVELLLRARGEWRDAIREDESP